MKTHSFVHALRCGAGHSLAAGLALMLLVPMPSARAAASAAELLEKGIYTEETKGAVKAATAIYQRIVEDPRADRSLVAQAQLRLGLCQLKLGNRPQAISALDQLTQQFPDKDKLLAIVEQNMPQVLEEMVQQIERNYLQEVDRGELLETAIRAIVGKLDARGGFLRTNDLEFLGAEQLKELHVQVQQKVAGIGVVLKVIAGKVIVQALLPGSPALENGVCAMDEIVAIDGMPLLENKLATAVRLLRGDEGTTVNVGVMRDGWAEAREFTLTRNTIRLPSVSGESRRPDNTWDYMLDDQQKLGYIRLSHVGRESTEEMLEALTDLQARGMKGLILDLRSNPGGLLDGAVAVADLFVDKGRIVTLKSRKEETVYDAKAEGTFTGFPMAVLVNRETASAAEIVAACLQDHHRAIVIGERTFGQGIVRSIFELKNGVGAMKLPVAAYYRPNGKSVNRYPGAKDTDDWGVSPDAGYEVSMSDEELKQYEQHRAAHRLVTGDTKPKTEFQDRALLKAVEFLISQRRAP